jgi:hypothetical protein
MSMKRNKRETKTFGLIKDEEFINGETRIKKFDWTY